MARTNAWGGGVISWSNASDTSTYDNVTYTDLSSDPAQHTYTPVTHVWPEDFIKEAKMPFDLCVVCESKCTFVMCDLCKESIRDMRKAMIRKMMDEMGLLEDIAEE